VPVDGNRALGMARQLARQEGIFCGTSGGATFAGAMSVAGQAPPNTTILCMLPDTGERYLSTPLFEGIPEQMTEEELQISRSTPGFRFDVKALPVAPEDGPLPVTAAADAFVDEAINDRGMPVVVFALEWCEFCWAVRKLFGELGIPYRSIDLDSVAFQEGDRGGQIREALRARLGSGTIPQIFVAGEHIGGATDTFQACKTGELQARLDRAGKDPFELLPNWLHKR
jgi:cysteine synthase A